MGVSIVELQKAIESLEDAIDLYKNANTDREKKAFRDAAIQRFEFSIELSWKTSMKVLGSTTAAAKNAVREMGRNDLISDVEAWLRFVEDCNETSHFYDEDVAKKVYVTILNFLPYVKSLLVKLKENN